MNTTNKSFFAIISILLLALTATVGSIAQTTNNPNDNNDANACFEGGTLAGVCDRTDADRDIDVDQQDKDWLWTCGWYLIRVEYGIFDSSVLDNICHDVIEIVEVEEVVVEKKKKKEEKICVEIDAGTYKDGNGDKFTDSECTIPQV